MIHREIDMTKIEFDRLKVGDGESAAKSEI